MTRRRPFRPGMAAPGDRRRGTHGPGAPAPAATGDLDLEIERPVAGGRMLARHEGRVVLVSGAIPGERVRARVERTQKDVVFARVLDVLRASDDRRDPGRDPACGGMAYAHVRPARQHELQQAVVVDAFSRIARIPIPTPVVHAGADRGYRMRVRVHVRDGRLGSFREGTHEICDVRDTGQVLDRTGEVIEALAACLARHGVARVEAVEMAENLDASSRVVHLDCAEGEVPGAAVLAGIAALDGVTGLSMAQAWSPRLTAIAGVPWVADPLSAFVDAGATMAATVSLRRHARSFFQANRFLTPALVQRVLARLDDGPIVDLYAGVGLFALAAGAARRGPVAAVEGDGVSARDLEVNAEPLAARVRVVHASVESYLGRGRDLAGETVVLDPPRTGVSREAMEALLAARPRRIVYVSCDVATVARDARRLAEAGYAMGAVEVFDLFPNTAHVEVLTSFDRAGATPAS